MKLDAEARYQRSNRQDCTDPLTSGKSRGGCDCSEQRGTIVHGDCSGNGREYIIRFAGNPILNERSVAVANLACTGSSCMNGYSHNGSRSRRSHPVAMLHARHLARSSHYRHRTTTDVAHRGKRLGDYQQQEQHRPCGVAQHLRCSVHLHNASRKSGSAGAAGFGRSGAIDSEAL